MQCPKCSHTKQRVLESRPTEAHVWRRRVCLHCHALFVTQEVITEARSLPTEANRYKEAQRKTPKYKEPDAPAPKFDTANLATFRW